MEIRSFTPRESKAAFDSGFRVMDSRFLELSNGFQSPKPKARISQEKISPIANPISKHFPDSGIRITLLGVIISKQAVKKV